MSEDKLTPLALKIVNSRIVTPVIIKAIPRRLREVVETIRPFTEEIRELVPRLMTPTIAPISPYPMKILPRFDMVASLLPKEVIFRIGENRNVEKIFYDRLMYAQGWPVVPEKGVFTAPHRLTEKVTFTTTFWTKRLLGCEVANQKGYLGRDVSVGIVDSGASRVHEQIRRVRFKTTMKQFRDEVGHGTWVTSCIGGVHSVDNYLTSRTRTPWRVACEGMAPECGLLAVKSLGFYQGVGSTSNIIDAVDICIAEGCDVINFSLGSSSEEVSVEEDPFYLVFEEVVKAGIIPIVAAGNSGPEPESISTPGAMPQALTVGVWDPIHGNLASFSSRGPTHWDSVKPDVIAPGVNVDSGVVGVMDKSGDGVPSRYSPLTGTSMGCPHIAGLVALMREAMKKKLGRVLDCDEIKTMMSAFVPTKDNEIGWGPLTWFMFERWLSTTYGCEL